MAADFAANPLHMQQNSSRKSKGLPRGRAFPKGMSGNPAGKRPGTRNRATIIAEEMLDCETRPLLRGAIEDAKDGDRVMSRFCLARIIPPRRERPVRFELPPIRSAADLQIAMTAVLEAVARGEITVGEAYELAQTVDTFIRAIDAADVERRLQQLENAAAQKLEAGDARQP